MISKTVVERLLLAKSLLQKSRFHPVAEPDSFFVGSQILTAHHAAELALAAIADQCGKLPAKDQQYLMDYLGSLKELHPERDVEGREYCRQLNRVRVDLKHLGILPDPKRWARVGETVYDYVSQWCAEYLKISFDDLDQAALLASPGVKKEFDSTREALLSGKYQDALVGIATALHLLSKQAGPFYGLKV